MRNRSLLTQENIHSFKEWAIKEGWVEDTKKVKYQRLRLKKKDKILIVYMKKDKNFLSVSKKDEPIIKFFLYYHQRSQLSDHSLESPKARSMCFQAASLFLKSSRK